MASNGQTFHKHCLSDYLHGNGEAKLKQNNTQPIQSLNFERNETSQPSDFASNLCYQQQTL